MPEDFNKRKLTAKKLVHTPFRQGWQFRVEPEDAPDDFDIYVKDITYGPIEIETEQDKVGGVTMTWPVAAAPVTATLTVRDHEDRRVSKWFSGRVAKMANADGTFNLPSDYVLKVRRYSLLSDDSEEETDEWKMIPTTLGEISESRDNSGHLEFPLVLIQFRS